MNITSDLLSVLIELVRLHDSAPDSEDKTDVVASAMTQAVLLHDVEVVNALECWRYGVSPRHRVEQLFGADRAESYLTEKTESEARGRLWGYLDDDYRLRYAKLALDWYNKNHS